MVPVFDNSIHFTHSNQSLWSILAPGNDKLPPMLLSWELEKNTDFFGDIDDQELLWACSIMTYRQTSNISHTWVGNKIVDHSDVVGASPVGAAPTTSSFSTYHLASMDWPKATARWDDNYLSFRIWCTLYKIFYSMLSLYGLVILYGNISLVNIGLCNDFVAWWHKAIAWSNALTSDKWGPVTFTWRDPGSKYSKHW